MTSTLFSKFDRVIVFDTETTGVEMREDEIIELGAVSLSAEGERESLNELIRLSEGRSLPPFITGLTGITEDQLRSNGVEKKIAAERFCHLLEGSERPLLVAYNAQFDLNFLYHFLRAQSCADVLRRPRFLDALTVYRDRREYPHKLCCAIEAYGLEDRAVNSHRAVDDARATAALLEVMEQERDDLLSYIDLFGSHPRYGVSGRRIASVTYRVQPFQLGLPLYERPDVP